VKQTAGTPSRSGEGSYLQTLGNGLLVLEELRFGPLGIQALMARIGTNRSTMYRLVATLVKHGFVTSVANNDTYSLGPRLSRLGAVALGPADLVRQVSAPHLDALANTTGETAHIARHEATDVQFIARAEGANPIKVSAPPAGIAPLHCTAAGKLLLAHSPRDRWSAAVAGLERYTDTTIVSQEALLGELRGVLDAGFSVNRGEWRAGVGGIAVPLMYDDLTFALGLSGPLERIAGRLQELVDALKTTAADMESTFGFPRRR
jgi:IclR family KDG regulon transcriptional repressor